MEKDKPNITDDKFVGITASNPAMDCHFVHLPPTTTESETRGDISKSPRFEYQHGASVSTEMVNVSPTWIPYPDVKLPQSEHKLERMYEERKQITMVTIVTQCFTLY